jgi:Trk K+ transport system NAD-binding subunit
MVPLDLDGGDETDWRRRTLGYGLAIAAVMVGYAVLYYLGMARLEGEQVTFLHSLQVVVETFTTTGYGSDAPWETPLMNVLVIVMDLTGVVLIFLALPLLLFPLFEEAVRTDPPVSTDLTDHVVVCGYSNRGAAFIGELDAWDLDHAVVVSDRETAVALHEAGETVVHADPETLDGLRRANAAAARTLVADADDEREASIVLAAKELAPELRVVAVSEDPDRSQYLAYAGADAVLTPRHLLGRSLANSVTASVRAELDDPDVVGDGLEVAEMRVLAGSELAGRSLAASDVGERTGADVIGAWRRGERLRQLDPTETIEDGVVLLAVGDEEGLRALRALARGDADAGQNHVVVAGYGEVGSAATAELAAEGVPYRVLDREDAGGVDVVGDATDEETLRSTGVGRARAVVLALDDDTETAYATLVLRQVSEDVEVVARVDDPDAEQKLYRAGADYVLSLATVSGRMLADEVLDEEVLSPDKQVNVVKLAAPGLVGESLASADVRGRTGVTVVAVERDGVVDADVSPDTVVEAGDELVVAGTDEAVTAFTERFR